MIKPDDCLRKKNSVDGDKICPLCGKSLAAVALAIRSHLVGHRKRGDITQEQLGEIERSLIARNGKEFTY